MSDEKQETIKDIVAEMREYESTPPPRDAWLDLADRIEAAWKREREEWSIRLADAHEVAEDFKNILTKALDTLAWLKSAESPAARGCGENGGGSSRKTEIEAMRNEKRGNAAKMREALVRCADIINKFGLAEIITTPMEVICDIEGIITAALSAPPRNCDIYDAESCRMAYHLHGDGLMTMQAFADWLFAPVEEGATNEQK